MPFLLIDKPAGITSHDVVDRIRRITGERRVGHAGTLDPFATGLLIVGVGRESTKQLDTFLKLDKSYHTTFFLGATADTADRTGVITPTVNVTPQNEMDVHHALEKFRGPISQIPPMYSAKKVGGKKLYELARQGVTIPRQPAAVTIHQLELIHYSWPILELNIVCSSGTYIRSLAYDLGQVLGVGAYVETLTRTSIGNYALANATALADITPTNWHTKVLVRES